ncbi:LysM peptidoglycan-binding domain-containing protein [Marinilabilia salmonicolor]|uniref:LysM peptidoglycan-binding domain-containing protein n=1 Tax=Marinilabilia salmonicolor TaxID=989 RepID=UPI00029A4EB3|nr:LysM domain-containing protein [Marinilabilia salmonicolor]
MANLINQTIFEGQLRDGTPCECFVEGAGYAFTMVYSIPPPHRQSSNPLARVSDDDSFTQNCILQFLDVSPHMRLMSNNYLHKVKQGENLTIISSQYDISVESIELSNPDIDWVGERQNGHYIYPGEVLKLPKRENHKSH